MGKYITEQWRSQAKNEQTGEPIPVSPRRVLKQQLQKAEEKGFQFKMASELEFYLFKQSYEEIDQNGYQSFYTTGHYNEDYNLLQGTRNEPFYQKVRNKMIKAGIPIESSKGEAYTAQHEMNMLLWICFGSCRQSSLFQARDEELCIQEGYACTFMAKPFSN